MTRAPQGGLPALLGTGSGRGPITPDGSAVELYRLLGPDVATVAFLREHLPPGCSVLDVGAGVGRIADPLARRGYDVTALDVSAAMLRHVRHARVWLGDVRTVVLDSTFDAVVVSAHLVDYVVDDRADFVAACARHLTPGRGRMLVQRQPRSWFDTAAPWTVRKGDRSTEARDLAWLDDDRLAFTLRYTVGGEVWEHRVVARCFDDETARALLARHGLVLRTFGGDAKSWILATSVERGRGGPLAS